MNVVAVQGHDLERVLDATTASGGLTRRAQATLDAALQKSPWGQLHRQRYALLDGADVLACVERHELTGTLDGRAISICALGGLFAPHDGRHHATTLIDAVIALTPAADVALLFTPPTAPEQARAHDPLGFAHVARFETVPLPDLTLRVTESTRYGAPMTMIRGGEERDLPAIVAMGRVRAEPFRFHLNRDTALVQYAITRKRLRAGLGVSGKRELHFFIAEEGITAAAYVVISVTDGAWAIEECGDRDPSGARLGAILQALIAREPAERRPVIRGWLPHGFVPPQVTIVAEMPPAMSMSMRVLKAATSLPPLTSRDVLYWRNDVV